MVSDVVDTTVGTLAGGMTAAGILAGAVSTLGILVDLPSDCDDVQTNQGR